MSKEESMRLFESSIEASLKFDYFVAGLGGALFAYIAQTYTPKILGWTSASLEPLSLALLAISVGVSLKRIETIILLLTVNQRFIENSNEAGQMTKAHSEIKESEAYNPETGAIFQPKEFAIRREKYKKLSANDEKHLGELTTKITTLYRVRNWFLLGGAFAIFLAKLLQPYA